MAEKKAKEVNIVDQNAIWRETIRKETRCQKLYTEYHINPYKARGRKFCHFLDFSRFGSILKKIFGYSRKALIATAFVQRSLGESGN